VRKDLEEYATPKCLPYFLNNSKGIRSERERVGSGVDGCGRDGDGIKVGADFPPIANE
jgi:hypothetical protein